MVSVHFALFSAAVLGHLPTVASKWCPIFNRQCCHITETRDPKYEDYRGNPQHVIPGWEELDLDAPATERWAKLAKPRADAIRTMIDVFKGTLGKISRELFSLLEDLPLFQHMAAEALDAMGEYGMEIRGIAAATGIPEAELLVYNVMYEVEGACTSIVAKDPASGAIIHGRNLDFGDHMAVDLQHLQWRLTEALRPLLVNVRFKQGGKVVFNSTVFVGYVGLLTGSKVGSFSLTVNTRWDKEGWGPILRFLTGKDRSAFFLSHVTRDVITHNTTYAEALATIRSAPLIGPAYTILSGMQAGEGAIVARSSHAVDHEWDLATAIKNGSNFIVMANYDWGTDPWSDNRRDPANKCLAERYNNGIDMKGLFQVLSARPNRNRATTYTALMRAQTGEFESYLQFCDEINCSPWTQQAETDLMV